MKTLKQLKEEIELQRALRNIAKEKSEYQREIRNAKKELSYLKHPSKQYLINSAKKAGSKFKKVGKTVSRNLKGMGKVAYQAGKNQAREIRREQLRKGYTTTNILRKRKLPKQLIKYQYKKRKKKRSPRRVIIRKTYNPMNPFGLDF